MLSGDLGRIVHEPFPDYPTSTRRTEEIEGWNQLVDQLMFTASSLQPRIAPSREFSARRS
jgi:hypothetical protein